MKQQATVMQITRGLLILTPAEYDKPDGGFATKGKRGGASVFGVPQIFELNDSLKEHPFEKTEELAAFVERCAQSVSIELGELFICIEDEDVLITKEYKHAPAKEKLLPTFARVEAEHVLHQEVDKYTILNFEYGQQYGKSNKNDDISASLFAMNTGMLTDIRMNFEKRGMRIAKVVPPIAGMLYTSKQDLNSSTRGIAVISVDFAATRLVVLHNGAPVFQQSFSSVLEDIAEKFSLEFGMSKMGAIDFIRQEGMGVCDKCKSADARKQTMTMLDNAAGEILRNLRMVISTKKIDIDTIVLCDAISRIPRIKDYCRNVGLTAPIESATNIFVGSATAPQTTPTAKDKGYDPNSYITLNGILTMPPGEANLLAGESNILSAMAEQSGNKIGKIVTGVICGVAALWMISVGGMWFAKKMQKNADDAALIDPIYDNAKQLIRDEKEYTAKLANIDKDLESLPRTELKSADIVDHMFSEIIDKVQSCTAFNLTNGTENHTITTSIDVKDYDTFVKFKDEVNETGYFFLSDSFTATMVDDTDSNSTTPQKHASVTITVNVTEETVAKAKEEFANKTAAKTASESAGGSSGSSSDSSSASST